MIPAPLPSAEQEGERLMLEPAWLGKMPTNARPLTDSAIKAWIRTGCLTPYGCGPPAWWRRPLARYGLGWLALGVAALAIWKGAGWL